MAKDDLENIRERYKGREFYRVWPEWSCPSCLWAPPKIGTQAVGGYVPHSELPISQAINRHLLSWHARFDDQIPERAFETVNEAEFLAQGMNIAIDLSKELGSGILIEYEIDDRVLLFENGRCVAAVIQEKTKI